MAALALKLGLELFIGKRGAQGSRRSVFQQFMKHPSGTSSHVSAPLAGRRIVLVASDRSLADILHQAGAEVIPAASAGGVPEPLPAQDGIDAVVLGLDTPGLDGLAAARAIRASGEPWAVVPVVAVAAPSDASARAALAAAGIDCLLPKPVETTLLYETLTRFMSAGAARGQRARGPGPAVALASPADGLLNLPRLDSYKRLGMLDELINDYLPEMARLVAALQEAAGRSDVPASLAALHSLLGMSGEAGAQGLYQHVRKIYVPLLEQGEWPSSPEWLPQLRQLAARTDQALRAYCTQQARPSAA